MNNNQTTKRKARAEALKALQALGYWDFVRIGQALELGAEKMAEIPEESRSINGQPSPEYLRGIKAKIEALQEATRALVFARD